MNEISCPQTDSDRRLPSLWHEYKLVTGTQGCVSLADHTGRTLVGPQLHIRISVYSARFFLPSWMKYSCSAVHVNDLQLHLETTGATTKLAGMI